MTREQPFQADTDDVFQACVNAVAYLKWYIDERDEHQHTIDIKTPFTLRSLSPTFQDVIDVEIRSGDDTTTVRVDSSPRFQLWNWGKDARNEKKFLGEVAREVQRITGQPVQSQPRKVPEEPQQQGQPPQQGQPRRGQTRRQGQPQQQPAQPQQPQHGQQQPQQGRPQQGQAARGQPQQGQPQQTQPQPQQEQQQGQSQPQQEQQQPQQGRRQPDGRE